MSTKQLQADISEAAGVQLSGELYDKGCRMGYTLETMKEIWDDKSGCHIEIGPDRDGLDLIEVRSIDDHGKIDARLSFTKEQASLIARAITELVV